MIPEEPARGIVMGGHARILRLIRTRIVFDGSLSGWWTMILNGILLQVFIPLQKGLSKPSQARLA